MNTPAPAAIDADLTPCEMAVDVADGFMVGFFMAVDGGGFGELKEASPDAVAAVLSAYLDACTAAYTALVTAPGVVKP